VLQAQADVETGLAAFFESQEQTILQKRSVIAAQGAAKAAKELVPARAVFGANGTTAQVVLLNLVQQQSLLAQAKGNIAQGLITTYLGLGGGWEIRCQPQGNGPLGPLVPPPAPPKPTTESPENEVIPKGVVPAPPLPDESAESN
jgi:outer membrane protein TolC